MTCHSRQRRINVSVVILGASALCLAGLPPCLRGPALREAGSASAAVPRTIHYQGKLTEPDGSPIVGEHTVTLRLYNGATAGSALWEEAHTLSLAKDDNGVFSVALGSVTPFTSAITFNEPLWLSTDIDSQGEFSPRQPLSAVTYAINADMLDGLDSTQLLAAAGTGITGVQAGGGLTGGGTTGALTFDVGAGTGLVVDPDAVRVDVGTTAGKIIQLDADGALPAVSGAALTNLRADALASGTLPDARLSSTVSLLGTSIESSEVTDGTLTAADTAATFLTGGAGITVAKGPASWEIASAGPGAVLTGVSAGLGLTGGGTTGTVTLDVGAGAGIVASADAISVDAGTGANQIVQLDAGGALPAVSGAALTALNADALASGTVPDGRLPSTVSRLGNSIESVEVTDGTLSAADTAASFLTAGSGVTINKGATSWDISAVGSGGDITSVTAGAGLTGGATSAEATMDVGAGTGIVVASDTVSVDVGTTDGKIVQLAAGGALPAVSGANLTSLDAANLASGTVPDGRLSSTVSLLGSTIESAEVTDGTLTAADTAGAFLAAGSGVTVSKGASSWQIDATGSGGTVTSVTAGTGLTGGIITGTGTVALSVPVAVADGGTGAATAPAARAALGAAASGANADITSLGGLTTPLSVGQGGTGAATLTLGGIVLGNGAAAVGSTGVLPKGSVVVGDGVTDPSVLSVGANGAILMADSAQASGLKWAAGCFPIGGADATGRAGTFQMAVFGMSDTNNRMDRLWPTPVAGTVTTLRAFVNQAPGGTNSWTVRLRKNAANASLTCTISGAATSCSASGTETVAVGDRLGAEFTEGGAAASTLGSGWSACLVPG